MDYLRRISNQLQIKIVFSKKKWKSNKSLKIYLDHRVQQKKIAISLINNLRKMKA